MPRAAAPGAAWSDFADSLIWPRLLGAPKLAHRIGSIALGTLLVVWIAGADRLPMLWGGNSIHGTGALSLYMNLAREPFARLSDAITKGDIAGGGRAVGELLVSKPLDIFTAAPLSVIVSVGMGLVGASVLSGAMCRSAALSIAGERRRSIFRMMRFSLERWWSFALMPLFPVALFYVAAFVLAALGWAGLSLPGVQVLGGALFFVALLIGLLGILMALAVFVATPMLIPALAAEGTDAVDAAQRSFAYAAARLDRLVLYTLILLLRGVLSVGLFYILAKLTSLLTLSATTAWVADPLASEIRTGSIAPDAAGWEWSHRACVHLVRFWVAAPVVIAWGYGVSYVCASGTLLYLAMRRVVDGQDMGEVWAEPMVKGTRVVEDGEEEEGN